VFRDYPEIASIKNNLYNSGAVFALMSGSGSSVYGLFDSEEQAVRAKEAFPGFASFVCKPFDYRNEIH
jgi:4-diphosphocytidyl-2-C-methyl-D-erythritol kinase